MAACRSGEIRLAGSPANVKLVTSGITNAYLDGVTKTVNLELSGITSAFITPANPDVQISGW